MRPKKPLLWLNVVCLDAPLVAIAWQWLFARYLHVTVSVWARGALFLTAWLIYLIDRLGDARSLKADSEPSVRQQFCLQHQRLWIGLIFATALLDAIIVISRLDRDLLLPGACLNGIALVYLAINYAFGQLWEILPLKEISIGLLFAAGTLLAVFPRFAIVTAGLGGPAVMSAISFFAILCSLNCMSIAAWERDLDGNQGKRSIATRCPRIGFSVRISCFVLAAAVLLLGVAEHQLFPIAICLSVSATLLAILHFVRARRDERTALADLVLLTPVALFFVELVL